MTDKTNSRREFLKATAIGAAGLALGSRASSYARIQGANNRVRVGIVGFSDRCRGALVPAFLANAKDMNFDFVAVSTSGVVAARKAPRPWRSLPVMKLPKHATTKSYTIARILMR